jgi:hypothetical protein
MCQSRMARAAPLTDPACYANLTVDGRHTPAYAARQPSPDAAIRQFPGGHPEFVMPSSLLLELGRAESEAAISALNARRDRVSVADAVDLVKHALAMSAQLRSIWEHPRRALGEAGLEAARFREVCRSTVEVLDKHLTLLGLVRQLAEEAAAHEGVTPPGTADLDDAEEQARTARQAVEDLLAFAERQRPLDWAKVREGQLAIERGESTRLNPGAGAPAEAG